MKTARLTRIELVVLILRILAAVAAPKSMNTSAEPNENVLRQTRKIVWEAITLYSAHNAGAQSVTDNDEETFRGDLAEHRQKIAKTHWE